MRKMPKVVPVPKVTGKTRRVDTKRADVVKIESGVPMPRRMGLFREIPWHEMAVGDSFVFPGSAEQARETINRARKTGVTPLSAYAVRTLKNGVVRVWRVW